MGIRRIIKLFEYGSVSVSGMRGRGKDLLTANVIVRRGIPYVSNVDYGGAFIPFEYDKINCGHNTYKQFISGKVNKYIYPYPDGTDIYLSDTGVYFPSQYCNELNRDYKELPTFMAVSRHLGLANVHTNAQCLNRVWDKIREQSDIYLLCRWCIYIPKVNIVIQKVTEYDRYETALTRQKNLRLPISLWGNKESRMMRKVHNAQFEAQHGLIKNHLLIYRNKSTYNTRIFKEMMNNDKTIN